MKVLIVTALILIGVSLTIVADVLLKKSLGDNVPYILVGFLVYGLISIPVAFAFKYTDFGKLFLIWEAVAVIAGVIVASIYYKEPFTGYRFVALVLALGALFFSYK